MMSTDSSECGGTMAEAIARLAALGGLAPRSGTCDVHGIYTAYAKAGEEAPCPRCEAARHTAQAQQHRLAERIAAIRQQLGVPERFAKSGLRDWHADSDNAHAVKAAALHYLRTVREQPAMWRTLLLSGPPGTGKTHLLCALANNLAEAGIVARYTTLQAMLDAIKSAYSDASKSEAGQIQRYVHCDFLALDEIDVMRGSDNDRALLFAVVNGRYNALKPIAIATNQTPEGLAEYITERVLDRLLEGAITLRCNWPSIRPGI